MIRQLRGKLIEKNPPDLLVEVGGVGYWVQAPLSTCFALPAIGQEVTLRIHQIIREDAHLLFGFATKEAWQLFQAIIKINGVGPKVALAILSALSPQEFTAVIINQSLSQLKGIPGIGLKTAQRILIEMQDKLGKAQGDNALGACELRSATAEAIAALEALGYKPQEASKAIQRFAKPDYNSEQLIKAALQGLAKA